MEVALRIDVRMLPIRSMIWSQFLLFALTACSSETREVMRVASPDHTTTVVETREHGGGAAGSAVYYLYMLEAGGTIGAPILTATYCGGLTVTWQGNSKLQVAYDSQCNIRQFVNRWWSKSAIQNAQVATVEIVLARKPD